jgi:hypothetical protein
VAAATTAHERAGFAAVLAALETALAAGDERAA